MARKGENLIKMFLTFYMHKVQDLNLDVMIAITGERGAGKTTLALRMAELLLELPGSRLRFDPEENIYYNLYEFERDVLNNRHRVMVIDEAAAQLFSRDFGTDLNKEIVKIVQISRDQNNIVIWVFPHFLHLDKGVRLYMQHVWKVRLKYLKNGGVLHLAKPYAIQTDYLTDRIKIVPATYRSVYGDYREAPWVTWELPSQELWEVYSRKKRESKERLVAVAVPPKRPYRNAEELILMLYKSDPDKYAPLFSPEKRSPERARLVKEIAKEYGYSPRHVIRVIQTLRQDTSLTAPSIQQQSPVMPQFGKPALLPKKE